MWEAMRIVADSAREHGTTVQMRTTVWPGSLVERTLGELQNATRDLGYELHIPWARDVDSEGNYVG